uniref:LINE-1 type transposase domain containing 1 n=1 Tax=Nothobranchius furzeri TaxID=105023 RepID=A0A1A7ZGX5_NOTFU
MPAKKAQNKSKVHSSPSEEEDVSGANNQAVSTGDASPGRLDVSTGMAQNLDVIQILDGIRSDFSTKIGVVLTTIQDVKRDVQDFSLRMDGAEKRISNVEDDVNSEKGKTEALVKQVALLTDKLEDLENRSRRSNLRLVNVPEKIEGNDAVAFLEKWLPEALGPATFPRQPLIERAHRLPGRKQPNRPPTPRVLIVKFLNFQDRVRVMRAASTKGKVICGGQEVLFFPDLSTDLHRRRRGFDRVKQQLRSMNIRYGLIYPAKLRVSTDEHTHVFETPADAEKFIKGLQNTAI